MNLFNVLNCDEKSMEWQIDEIVNNFDKKAQLACAREGAYNEQWVIAYTSQYEHNMYDARDKAACELCVKIKKGMSDKYWPEEIESDKRVSTVKFMLHRTLVQSFTSVICLAAAIEAKGYSEGLYTPNDESRVGEYKAFIACLEDIYKGGDILEGVSYLPFI